MSRFRKPPLRGGCRRGRRRTQCGEGMSRLRAAVLLAALLLSAALACRGASESSLRWVDWADETHRQVEVDREPGQYLGHPTTVLLSDERSILTLYPKGHGAGPIVMKRSGDGGLTWSQRLPTPASWATSMETPTVFPVDLADGRRRLIMFSGLYPVRIGALGRRGRDLDRTRADRSLRRRRRDVVGRAAAQPGR